MKFLLLLLLLQITDPVVGDIPRVPWLEDVTFSEVVNRAQDEPP